MLRVRLTFKQLVWILSLVVVLTATAQVAFGHSWYDPTCCSGRDCAPIPDDSVTVTPEGYHVRLEPGDHPLVKSVIDTVIPFGSDDVMPSQDEHYHACVSMGSPSVDPTVLCLYVGGGTS